MALGMNPKVRSIVTVAFLATLFSGLALAQDEAPEPTLAGEWETTVTNPMTKAEGKVILILEEVDGKWTGSISNDLGESEDLLRVRVNGNRIQFAFPENEMNLDVNYSGMLDSESGQLLGNVETDFGDQEMNFHRRVTSVQGEDGQKKYAIGSGPAGVWLGKVRMPDGEDQIVKLTLDSDEQGDPFAVLEDPFIDQVRGEDVKISDTMISFTYRPEGQRYPSNFTGSYVAADDRLTGSFSQRGASRFVKFSRDPETTVLGFTDDGQIIEPARTRHQHNFSVTGRLSHWLALHMVKDETYTINSVTTSRLGLDGTVRFYAQDALAIFGRYFRGGFGMTDDPEKLANHTETGLTSDSSLNISGWEFGVTGYLGNIIKESSRFNPYMTAAVGKASWEVNAEGRGSDILAIEDDPLEGSDWVGSFGLGTEYEMSPSFNLEFEWMWRYIATEDEFIWNDTENDWTNTHAWTVSVGATYLFW